jgi:hypothetical protein
MFRPARWVRIFILGLALAGLLGALGLAYAGYRAHRISAALNDYGPAASLYRARTTAIHRLSDMETAFHRFLLDGNSANLTLMERDKEAVELFAQQDAELRADKLLQDMVAKEQRWYSQAQPLIEQRRSLPPGQGISEEFLAHYRAASPDLNVISFEIGTESAFRESVEAVQSEKQTRVAFLMTCILAAVFLILLIFTLASRALKQTGSSPG